MDENLKYSLHYLGKYINSLQIAENEWMSFHVNVNKIAKGIVKFRSPSLLSEDNTDETNLIISELSQRDMADNDY